MAVVLSAHTLAELHATLTALPVRPRISPQTAGRLRDDNLPQTTEIVVLTAADYRAVLGRVAALGLAGGIVYDALTARAAEKAGVDRLVTLNEGRFRRVWAQSTDRITGP